MSSSDEDADDPPSVYNTRNRPKLLVVNAGDTSFLERLVTEGLESDAVSSFLSDSDEEELLDFDGSDIEDPDYVPSDNNNQCTSSDEDTSDSDSVRPNVAGDSASFRPTHGGQFDSFGPNVAGHSASFRPTPGGQGDSVRPNVAGHSASFRPTLRGQGDSVRPNVAGHSASFRPTTGGHDDGFRPSTGGHGDGFRPTPGEHSDDDTPGEPSNDDTPGGHGDDDRSVSDEHDTSIFGCTWVEENVPFTLPPTVDFPDYTQNDRLNIDIHNPSPINIYCNFIDDELWDYMAQETNRFAIQHLIANEPSIKSRARDWLPTTRNEMKRFVGIMICMGLVDVPHINLYWSKNPLYGNPLIKQTMTRDRFLLLKKFWHFANNQDPQVHNDRLAKIRTLVEYLNSAFMDALVPGKDLVIDETMIPWRGRLIFRQYIKNKSHKYGVKVYKLCTVDGYTLRMVLYEGKTRNRESDHGHTYDIVLELMGEFQYQHVHFDGYLNVGRTLTTDNFYTGIPIAEKLLENKTRMCGTVNLNRKGLPKELVKTSLKKGGSVGYKCQHGTKVIKWKDKRIVTMVSTSLSHNSKLVDTRKKNRMNQPIMKPKCVLDYNSVKKGVDYSDQMSSYYTTLRKSLKWYKKVALELLTGTTMVNSWVLYKKITNHKMPMVKFREMVARSLMGIDANPRQNLTPPGRKRPHSLKKTEGVGRKKRRRCKGCYEKNRRASTSREADRTTKTVNTFCQDCPGEPFYCLDCFREKHT